VLFVLPLVAIFMLFYLGISTERFKRFLTAGIILFKTCHDSLLHIDGSFHGLLLEQADLMNQPLKLFLAFVLLLYGAACLRSEDQPVVKNNLAVAEFSGKNVSQADASIVSDFVRTEIVKTDEYNIVEKANMEKILAEAAFQQTGCTTSDCAVQLGKILNVQKMIVGSLSKLEGAYYISANLVDVETGKIDRSESVNCEKATDLKSAAEDLADSLVSKTEARPTGRIHRKWFALGLGNPYLSAVFNIGNKLTLEGRFATDTDLKLETNLYALRFYWNFRKPKYNPYLAFEYGVFTFQGLSLNAPTFTMTKGYMAGVYPGVEFFVTKNLSVNGDIGASYIDANGVVSGIEWIVNAGVRMYIF
jgi:hypothetical protein